MALEADSRSNRSAGASERAGCNNRKPARATGRNGGRGNRGRRCKKYRVPDPGGHATPAHGTPRVRAWSSGLRATPTSFRSSVGDGETCWAEFAGNNMAAIMPCDHFQARTRDRQRGPSSTRITLAKRERISLDARIQEFNGEGMVPDVARLANQLI